MLPAGWFDIPALFQRTSRRDSWARNSVAQGLMVVRSLRSRWRLLSIPGVSAGRDFIEAIAAAILVEERLAI